MGGIGSEREARAVGDGKGSFPWLPSPRFPQEFQNLHSPNDRERLGTRQLLNISTRDHQLTCMVCNNPEFQIVSRDSTECARDSPQWNMRSYAAVKFKQDISYIW